MCYTAKSQKILIIVGISTASRVARLACVSITIGVIFLFCVGSVNSSLSHSPELNRSTEGAAPNLADASDVLSPLRNAYQPRDSGKPTLAQEQIWSLYSEAEQALIRSRLIQLSAVPKSVGYDFEMQVLLNDPGGDFSWDPNDNIVYINPDELLSSPIGSLRFKLTHEGGHRRVSCPHLIDSELYTQLAFPIVYNFVEDPRTNNFLKQGDPAFVAEMQEHYQELLNELRKAAEVLPAAHGLTREPRYLMASWELKRQWMLTELGVSERIDPTLPEDVQQAVALALDGARTYWRLFPSKSEASNRAQVENYAVHAHEVLRDQIWPHICPLIQADFDDELRSLSEQLKSNEEGSGGPEGEASDQDQQKKEHADLVAEVKRRMEALASDLDDQFGMQLPPQMQDDPVRQESPPERVQDLDLGNYLEALKAVAPLVDQLVRELRPEFSRRRKGERKTRLSTGLELDFDTRIDEIARGVHATQSEAWVDVLAPKPEHYAVTLLIDLSGSMSRHGKIEETFKAAVLLTEVLAKLNVRVEILGFNEKLYEFKSHGELLNDKVRSRIGTLPKKVFDPTADRNDDGWALQSASERLEKLAVTQKHLWVMSDGKPNPSLQHASAEWELSAVIRNIVSSTEQFLVGLGVGPRTEHVDGFYPQSLSNLEVSQLAEKLAGLLRNVILDRRAGRRSDHE